MADNEAKIDLGIAGLGPAEHIGRGGFADVYRAEQLSLRRTVAVKVLRAQASDPEAEARFQRECHAIGAVSDHPHIVGVHEGGFTRNGRAYLVMEYLPGGSLSERLRDYGPMPVSEVVATGMKIGKALSVAHRTGVLHRDIKPANIMISAYGEPALGDFGIARIEGGHKTATGLVTASFAHAAPEVLEGQPPSPGADIYSLGTTIFELLTGRAPYFDPADESIWPLMKRILSEPMPTPESVGMSPRLGAVFTRATARNTDERYQDAEEMVDDLALLASDPLSLTLYPPSGEGSGPQSLADFETDPLDGPMGPTGPRSLIGGLPLQGAPPPVTKPDLTSVYRPVDTPASSPDRPAPSMAHPPSQQGPAATTNDLPPAGSAAYVDGPARSRSLGPMAVGLLAVAGLAGLVLLVVTRPWSDAVGDVAAGDQSGGEFEFAITDDAGQAVDGPLTAGATYAVEPADADVDVTFNLLIDGIPADGDGPPLRFEVEPGHHLVEVERTAPAVGTSSGQISVYAVDQPAGGYRATLASIHVERQGWDVAMDVFDRLQAEGHTDLQLMATDGFSTLTPGYWTLYVAGFGEDPEAAEAYCARFDLAIPTDCYAGYLDPSGS